MATSPSKLLTGKVALVTGASRGIGAAAADLLAKEGGRVIRVARTLKAGSSGQFEDISCDLTDAKAVGRLVWDPFDPDHREGFPSRADMLRANDVAEAILFVATRPEHVLIDWLRLGPTGRTSHG